MKGYFMVLTLATSTNWFLNSKKNKEKIKITMLTLKILFWMLRVLRIN
jgi:hypothetical protein